MAKFTNAIFDMDGTIINSEKGVTESVIYSLQKMNSPPLTKGILKQFIGPSLYDSYTNHCHMNDSEAKQAINYYREIYVQGMLYECEIYDGIIELLTKLKMEGVRLSIASSKPIVSLKKLLAHLDLARFFEKVVGSSYSETSSDKHEYVSNARLEENAVMIGDRCYDIVAAKSLKIPVIAVTYGFGDTTEFTDFNADYIAANADDIYNIITNG